MRRFFLACVCAATSALLLPAVASADTMTPVSVDCGDGAPLSATVDSATLTSLQASIQGMVDNPAGVSCDLTLAAITDPTIALGSSGASNPYVVGGGRYDRGPGPGSSQGCGVNFAISAHTDSTGARGQQSYTTNNADGCGSFEFQGHVKANVTCLSVVGNTAQMIGTVTEVSGFYTTIVSVGDLVETDVEDNGTPSSGTPDTIGNYTYPAGTAVTCTVPQTSGNFPVENGNITVHN